MQFNHVSVLLEESVSALNVKPDGIYVDCTAGGGGHSARVLEELGPDGRMILIDRDPDAVSVCTQRFAGDGRVTVVHDNFSNIKSILGSLGIGAVDGVIADLGVSSYQLDTPERGFSFHNDALLDMRMSKTGKSAFDVVNTYTQAQLAEVISRYGEEKFARSIASGIVSARQKGEIKTTLELAAIISAAVPAKYKREGHPARKTFQAIRIEVNGELDAVRNALPDMFDSLKIGGTVAIISFHSLEDKIVKDYFNTLRQGCTCPRDFPVCVCGKKPRALVKSGGIRAAEAEVTENQRSRSAKLRTAVRFN